MKQTNMSKVAVLVILCSVSTIALGTPSPSEPSPLYTIEDNNSTASFNLISDQGMYNWTINGVDQMKQQWFWYRIGDTGPEHSISTLDIDWSNTGVKSELDDPSLPDDNENEIFFVNYIGEGFKIYMEFSIHGSSMGDVQSHITESIKITNTNTDTNSEALDFHFFQFCDLDLGGTANDTSLQITSGEDENGNPFDYFNTAEQSDEGSYLASESVVSILPSHYEAYSSGSSLPSILTRLNDEEATDLENIAGPFANGDFSWAFQWDVKIAPQNCVQISKLKGITPEPTTVCLLGIGGVSLLIRRRRK